MKIKLILPLVLIFCLFSATTCDDPPFEPSVIELKGIELNHYDNSMEKMFRSDKPIKKEAYVIGVKYVIKKLDNSNKNNYSRFPTNIKKRKIYTLNDFDKNHPKGSDVSNFFTTWSNPNTTDADVILVLNKIPLPGAYAFKIEYECTDATIIQETTPVVLY